MRSRYWRREMPATRAAVSLMTSCVTKATRDAVNEGDRSEREGEYTTSHAGSLFTSADNRRAQGVARSRRVDAGLTHFSQLRFIVCGAHSYLSSSVPPSLGTTARSLPPEQPPRFRRLSFARHVDLPAGGLRGPQFSADFSRSEKEPVSPCASPLHGHAMR